MARLPLTRPPLLRLVEPEPANVHPQLPMPSIYSCAPPHDDVSSDLERVAIGFYRALAEVLNGRRPFAQLRPMLAPQPASVVAELLLRAVCKPLRPTRVWLQAPSTGVIEAAARLASPGTSCALAIRLEHQRGRWRAVALEAALRDDGHPRR